MSVIQTGNPANVTTPITRNVSGAVNNGSGAIRLTTTADHHFGTFDTVIVASVGGVTNANGTWTITVISSTQFDLVGSTFAGTYTSGGTAEDVSLSPQIQIPQDGEALTWRTLGPVIQAILDRSQYLNQRIAPPTMRLLAEYQTGASGTFTTTYFTAGGWKAATSFTTGNEQPLLTLATNPQINDVIEAVFTSTIQMQCALVGGAGDNRGAIDLERSINGGTSAAFTDAYAMVVGKYAADGDLLKWPVTLIGSEKVNTSGPFIVNVNGCVPTSPATPNFFCCSLAWSLVVRHWRPN